VTDPKYQCFHVQVFDPLQTKYRTQMTATLVMTLALGCSTTPSATISPAIYSHNNRAPQLRQGSDLLGIWNGTTVARNVSEPGRRGAQQLVTITLLEGQNSTINGYYKCSYGNQTCFRQNTTGDVMAASLEGSRILIRIRLHDATTCMFSGKVMNSLATGGYAVYAGGGILEQGDWSSRHNY
jgi:hypothetical protein